MSTSGNLLASGKSSRRLVRRLCFRLTDAHGALTIAVLMAGESSNDPPELPLHDHHMNRARAEREYTHLYHAGDVWTRRRQPMEIVR
jgi:hypothetical protein